MHLILYTKSNCCLCEGLLSKLEKLQFLAPELDICLDVRDIDSNPQWQAKYELSVPRLNFLCGDREQELPPISPRTSEDMLKQMLQKQLSPKK